MWDVIVGFVRMVVLSTHMWALGWISEEDLKLSKPDRFMKTLLDVRSIFADTTTGSSR